MPSSVAVADEVRPDLASREKQHRTRRHSGGHANAEESGAEYHRRGEADQGGECLPQCRPDCEPRGQRESFLKGIRGQRRAERRCQNH